MAILQLQDILRKTSLTSSHRQQECIHIDPYRSVWLEQRAEGGELMVHLYKVMHRGEQPCGFSRGQTMAMFVEVVASVDTYHIPHYITTTLETHKTNTHCLSL